LDFGFVVQENSSPADYLREMQCMWFELEIARAYRRLKKYGEALKKCHEIDRVDFPFFFVFQLVQFLSRLAFSRIY
jgi:hypothetical protein